MSFWVGEQIQESDIMERMCFLFLWLLSKDFYVDQYIEHFVWPEWWIWPKLIQFLSKHGNPRDGIRKTESPTSQPSFDPNFRCTDPWKARKGCIPADSTRVLMQIFMFLSHMLLGAGARYSSTMEHIWLYLSIIFVGVQRRDVWSTLLRWSCRLDCWESSRIQQNPAIPVQKLANPN
jgi:hypothetical protein